MPSLGHFSEGYYLLLRKINRAGGVACEESPSLFFPEDIPNLEVRQKATKAAKELCKVCPILDDCRTYAIENREPSGIWGATSPDER